jgi:hypothetical protein
MISAYSSLNSLSPFLLKPPVVDSDRGARQSELNSSLNRAPSEASNHASSTLAMNAWSASENREAEIQVQTREGDIVTIRMQHTRMDQQSVVYAQQSQTHSTKGAFSSQSRQVAAYHQQSVDQSAFSIRIEGNLNDDEKQALSDLINNMNEVSTQFFNGDIASAFKQAQKLGFDQEQIAGFSMNLNREQSVQAINAYQQVETYDVPNQNDLVQRAKDFLADSRLRLADNQMAMERFDEPQQVFQGLLEQVALLSASRPATAQSRYDDDIALLLDWVKNPGNLNA